MLRKLAKQIILPQTRCSPLFVAVHTNNEENVDSNQFEFTPENYQEIEKILAKYPKNYKRSGCIPLLMLAQKQNNNFLSISAMRKCAKIMDVPEIQVFETASFYTMFNRVKVGKYHLQMCGTTPCQLCGSREVQKALEKHLGIHDSETTPDGLFTIQQVECLGACVNAPMMQVNNEWVYEDLTPESAINVVEQFRRGETPKKGPQINRNNSEGPLGRTSLKSGYFGQATTRDFQKEKQDWLDAKEKAKQESQKK